MSPLLSRTEKPLVAPKVKETPTAPVESSELAQIKEALAGYGFRLDDDLARKKDEADRRARAEEERKARAMQDEFEAAKTQDMVKKLLSSGRVIVSINEKPVTDPDFRCPSCGRVYAEAHSALWSLADSYWRCGFDPAKSYLESTGYTRSLPYTAVAQSCQCGKSEPIRVRMWVVP